MPCPAEWTRLLQAQAKDRLGVHVTDCLGCPRRKALVRTGATVDLARLEARLNGSMLHKFLGQVDPDTSEIPVHGRLGQHFLVGSVDRVREPEPGELSGPVTPGLRVYDYKGEKAGGKARRPDKPYPEQVWQFETYRFLLGQMGTDTVGWTVWFRYGEEWIDSSHDGPVWAETDLLRFRPNGSNWAVADILDQLELVERGTCPTELAMVGETMVMGKGTTCNWCEVEGPCKATAALTPF